MAKRQLETPADDFIAGVLALAAELEKLRRKPEAFARLVMALADSGGPEAGRGRGDAE